MSLRSTGDSKTKADSLENVPHKPFYKDEKILGRHVTVVLTIRVLLVALVVFAVVVGAVIYKIIDYNQNFRALYEQRRADRLSDQAKTDEAIQDLACLAVAEFPSGSGVTIDKLRAQYNCPPYSPPAGAPVPTPTPTDTTVPPPVEATPSVDATALDPQQPRSAALPPAPTPAQQPTGPAPTGSEPEPVAVAAPEPVAPVPAAPAMPRPVPSSPVAPLLQIPGVVEIGGTCTVNLIGICI